MGVGVFPPPYDEPTEHWESNGEWENNTGIYLTCSLGVFGQEGMKYYSDGKWWYPYRINGEGEGRYVSSGDPDPSIHRQRVKVEKHVHPDFMGFKKYDCPDRAGAWPRETGSNPAFYTKFFAVVQWATNLMEALYFPFLKAAADLAHALLSDYNSEVVEPGNIEIIWEWIPIGQSDVSHVYMWDVGVTANQTASFIVHDCSAHSIYIWFCLDREISIAAPPPEPAKMSATEKRRYGVKEIPLSEVKEWGAKRGLSHEMVEEILKRGEPVYTARILPGEVTSRRAWSSKIPVK